MTTCQICTRQMGQEGLRLGVCFDCADAESIIDEGLDMWDKGPSGDKTPAKTAREKLEYLIKIGWRWRGTNAK